MNKQGNTYTILYSAIMVIVVAAILAFASVSLRPLQQENIRVDKMMQILSSVHIASTAQDAVLLYDKYITDSYVVDAAGNKSQADAFGIDVASEVKQDPAKRRLPVFVCTLDNGDVKYILPLYGAGLWGPIVVHLGRCRWPYTLRFLFCPPERDSRSGSRDKYTGFSAAVCRKTTFCRR